MTALIILARIVHIVSAVLWVGGFAAFLLHVQPAMTKTRPGSGPFFNTFLKTFSPYLAIVAPLTVLGGAFLYWNDSAGLKIGWITTHAGLAFSFGALCGISGWILGFFAIKPRVDRMMALGAQMAAAAGRVAPAGSLATGASGSVAAASGPMRMSAPSVVALPYTADAAAIRIDAAAAARPVEDPATELARLGKTVGRLSNITFILLGLALLAMATARYL